MPSSSVTIVSKSTVYPDQKTSTVKSLKLSVSDLPMLSCHYIQKGVLLLYPPYSFDQFISSLKRSLSAALSIFRPLAGRLHTDSSSGHVYILCNDAGADFVQAKAKDYFVNNITLTPHDVHHCFKEFFVYDRMLSYSGHFKPLLAVQVTELADGVFIGCTVNHSVTDGTSFWHFFNTFAAICKGAVKISNFPDCCRDTVFNSPAVLQLPDGGPKATFSGEEPMRERIFHFSRQSILKLKYRANNGNLMVNNGKDSSLIKSKTTEISSFQSLCAQLWRSVTRARKLPPTKTTTFRMAINCRHRIQPKLDPFYFGNAIQSIPTIAESGELLSHDLCWGANLLHQNVVAYDDVTVRKGVAEWEKSPRLFPLGNFDGAMITMGSSPRFPMYNNDFGWGRPIAIRSGWANKFDGKISAFPGREENGGVDLEVVLAPDTMAGLENDTEFMQYVSSATIVV